MGRGLWLRRDNAWRKPCKNSVKDLGVEMAIDTTIIKPDNLLATGPTASNTAVPSKVTQLTGQNVWEYEFSNTWPQTGIWTITLNADEFSIPKGTVLGSFTISQGTVYKIAVNWETTETVSTLAGRVTALETSTATSRTNITQLQTDLATANTTIGRLNTAVTNLNNAATPALRDVATHTTQIAALTTRVTTLETQLTTLEAQVTALTPAP
jgi:outer membrane murein-binding lipoprotein Lpp